VAVTVLIALSMVVLSSKAYAQPAPPREGSSRRAYVGLALLIAARGDRGVDRAGREGIPWHIEGGFAVGDRATVGAELAFPEDVSRTYRFFTGSGFDQFQRERHLQAIARVEVWSTRDLTINVVGGGGVVMADYTRTSRQPCTFPPAPWCVYTSRAQTRHALFSLGLEIAVMPHPHFGFAIASRVVSSARPDHDLARAPSTRSAHLWLGVGPRLAW
jgi:hypothetical protein